jgi:Flp pilus assembly protein TadG
MIRWLKKREAAQSLVEFSMMLPIFLILLFGVFDFGMGLRAYISVAQATREGARFASIGNPAGTFTSGGTGDCNGSTNTTTVGKVCSTMGGLNLANVSSVSVTYPTGNSPGRSVRVSAQYDYHYITPLRRLVTFFSAGALGSTITVSSTTDMRLE